MADAKDRAKEIAERHLVISPDDCCPAACGRCLYCRSLTLAASIRAAMEEARREEREALCVYLDRLRRDLVEALERSGTRMNTSDLLWAIQTWKSAIRARVRGGTDAAE
jgi:hypothetical protein